MTRPRKIWPWALAAGALGAVGGLLLWWKKKGTDAAVSTQEATSYRATTPASSTPSLKTLSLVEWKGGQVEITVKLPRARIDWDAGEWADSRLEENFQRGEVLSFETATSITRWRHKGTDASYGGSCWGVPDQRWILEFPAEVVVVTDKAYQALRGMSPQIIWSVLVSALHGSAVAKKKICSSDNCYEWYTTDGRLYEAVTFKLTVPAGPHRLVLVPQEPQTNHWCAPRGWWEWGDWGPKFKSQDYMKENCTSWMTKFDRSVSYGSLDDCSIPVLSGKVTLSPTASIYVGKREHWEPSYGHTFYAMCRARQLLANLIAGAAMAFGPVGTKVAKGVKAI